MVFKMLTIFKNRVLVLAALAALVVSGATAAFAATHPGQRTGQTMTHDHPSVTATAQHKPDKDNDGDKDSEGQEQGCSGQDGDLQELLKPFHLSAEKNSAAVTAVCALHAGTFKGTTTKGISVTSKHAYGFGEIGQLLFLAHFLATKDNVKLSDANVSSYLASALQTCASSSSTRDCLKNTLPNFNPDSDGEKDGK